MFLAIFLVLSLNLHLTSQCSEGCREKPVFTPSTLVVKYGDPTSANCTVCQNCTSSNFDVVTPVGDTTQDGNTILWTVDSLTEWGMQPMCYYALNDGSRTQCCRALHLILYKPPDVVVLSFVNHTGPMVEGGQYTLRCFVQDVAPVQKLSVTFYKGQTALGQPQISTSTSETPVSESFTLNINSTKEDNGVQYWCEAKLDLGPAGPAGPQPPPVVMSQSLTATVYYKPEVTGPPHPDPIVITEGNLLQLNCSAVGHPSPSYVWTAPSQSSDSFSSSILTINSPTTQDTGKYTCLVTNTMGSITVEFDVDVKANITGYIILGVLLAVVAVVIVAVVLYRRYYKQNKMGKYDMKKALCHFQTRHSPLPLAE